MPKQMTVTPDLKTRESVMFAAGRAQYAVTSNVTNLTVYIKIECKISNGKGQGYQKGTAPLELATHVFVSEKGYGTPRVGTYYPPREGYDNGRFFTDWEDNNPHVWAFEQIVALVSGYAPSMDCQITVENSCGMCGRKLEDPESVRRGIGPECASKPTGTKLLHLLDPAQQTIPVAPDGSPVEADDNAVLEDPQAGPELTIKLTSKQASTLVQAAGIAAYEQSEWAEQTPELAEAKAILQAATEEEFGF